MNNQRLIISIERKYTPFYKGLIISFCLIFVFVSTAYSPKYTPSILLQKVHDFFHTGIFHIKFFSIFEIIFLLILFFTKIKFNISFKYGSNFAIGLLTGAIICYIFRMINPYGDTINPIIGMPLLSNINEYLFLLFLYIVLFWEKLEFTFFIKILFKYVFIFSFLRVCIIFIQWFFFNVGFVRYSNVNITVWEPDTLFLFSFMQAMSLGLYLITKKKLYLFSTILFLIIGFFSQQRSTFYPGFFASVFGLFIYFRFKKKIIHVMAISIVLIPFIIILSMNLSMKNSNSKIFITIERYLSSLPGYESSKKQKEFSDTGHWEQSKLTTLSIMNETPFWGIGYGNSELENLYGQTTNIHNAYAGMWYRHGILTLLFYLFIFLIILSKFIITLKNMNNHNYNLFLLKIFILLYLIGYFFTAYFTPEGTFTNIRWQMLWVFLLAFILKTDYKSYSLIFK